MSRLLILFIASICSFAVCSESTKPLTLSLQEAIFLAVRENPNVQRAQLNHVQQKYALEVAHWQFQPHYAFTMATTMNRNTSTGYAEGTSTLWAPTPAVSLKTPIGTDITLTAINNIGGHYNPQASVQIVQPLIRGFGKAIVEMSLYNAMDNERVSRLNVENTLRLTVTAVISAYLDLISAENTVKIDQEALERAELSVKQTGLFIKAGRKAGVELITVQADVASAQTKLENDKNSLEQTRYALLTAIGIDPSKKFIYTSINVPQLIKRYRLPSLEETKRLTLVNDIQYQINGIMLNGMTKRSVLAAEDNTRWQLNLTATALTGGGSGGGRNAGINSLSNGANASQNLQLNLVIPINDKSAKQGVLNAKIGLREAQIAYKQERWEKETKAINSWNTLLSAERALQFAENAEKLQQETYRMNFQKYSYGLIDSVELQSVQLQLIVRQQSLLSSQIAYLKALINLDQQLGQTLQTWNVKARYG